MPKIIHSKCLECYDKVFNYDIYTHTHTYQSFQLASTKKKKKKKLTFCIFPNAYPQMINPHHMENGYLRHHRHHPKI